MFKGRREDARLVVGRGRYTADVNVPNQAYGCFLYSPHAHARIAGVDAGAAKAVAGVLGVFTGQDLAATGWRSPPPLLMIPGRNGTVLKVPDRPALAHDTVRYVGEPVALVVAETREIAQDAAELIQVDYELLAPAIEAEQALEDGAPLLHASAPGNLALDYEYGDAEATDAAFAGAAHVVSVTLEAQRIAGNPMEPKGCLVDPTGQREGFDLYMPTQGMGDIRSALAHVTGRPAQLFRVHPIDVGGAFGVRNEVYPEFVAVLHAAGTLGRAVKWTSTRSETLLSDHHARAARLQGSLALDAKGRFLALRVAWLVDLGAYCSNAGPLINTVAAPTNSVTGIYRIPAAHGRNRLVFTNTTPTTAYRGAGRPNVAYLCERLVDEAARTMGLDRVKLRRLNLLKRDDFPYRTPTKSVFDSGDPPALLARALDLSDWDGFARRRKDAKRAGKLRGIGVATFIEPSGAGGQEQGVIRFTPAGGVELFSLAGPSGQGHETVFPELVAGILGLPADTVRLRFSDPDGPVLKGTGSFGSRSLISHGSSLVRCAEQVIAKARELAATQLEVASADLVFEQGRFAVPGTDLGVTLVELIRAHAEETPHPLDADVTFDTSATFPSGAHVAEVEIDPDTGVLQIVNYVAVDDCGTVINHTIVEGQVIGGLMQGIGQVLGEHCVYSDEGQPLSGSFMDYYMPRAVVLPRLTVAEIQTPSPNNPLGAKGAGEAGATGSVPALAGAVLDALAPLGIHHVEMPYTPHRLWTAIRAAGNRPTE